MWRPKNYHEASLPIQLISWLYCVGIIQYPLNHPQIGLTIFYTIMSTCTYVLSLSYTISFASNSSWFKNSEVVLFNIIYINTFIYLGNIILMWISKKVGILLFSINHYMRLSIMAIFFILTMRTKQTNGMVKRAMRVDEILAKLDVPLDYHYIYVLSLKTVFLWSVVLLSTIGIDMMWLNDRVDLLTNFIIVFVLLHTIHANTIVIISISLFIHAVKCRFEKVNQMLLNIDNSSKADAGRRWPPLPLTTVDSSLLYNSSSSRSTSNDIMHLAKHLHLELSLLSNECSRIFGVQLAMDITVSFIIVTGVTFVFYIVMVSPIIDESSKLLRAIVLIYWLVNCYIKIVNVNAICADTTAEWKKTGKIIHQLAIVNHDGKLRDEIRHFSLQIMQNPVLFTARGLLTLGYSLVHSFIGSVTTYVVILVQMYDTPS